jgi:hypothetical protein
MGEFKCSNCSYKSPFKPNVKSHINKKNKCSDGKLSIITLSFEIKCEHCDKSYASKSNLTKHLNICKTKKANVEEEVKKLKIENEILKALSNKPTTNIGTQNNTINNINIQLSAWNDPKLPDNIEEYYRAAVKKVFLAVPSLIKMIHFNEDHPENHNICIKNARNKTAKVYNGKEWETVDQDDLIQTLITDYEQTLEDYAEEKNLKYNAKIQEIKDRDTEEKVYDDLHNIVKCTLYDRNHMVKIRKIKN